MHRTDWTKPVLFSQVHMEKYGTALFFQYSSLALYVAFLGVIFDNLHNILLSPRSYVYTLFAITLRHSSPDHNNTSQGHNFTDLLHYYWLNYQIPLQITSNELASYNQNFSLFKQQDQFKIDSLNNSSAISSSEPEQPV